MFLLLKMRRQSLAGGGMKKKAKKKVNFEDALEEADEEPVDFVQD